jgi:hypothetical protein
MKIRKLHPSDLVLRCLALQRKGYWVAMCIDLDLAVQADSAQQAQKLLNEQIFDYVAQAFSEDSDHAVYLLSRRAPLQYFAMYYGIKWLNHAKRYFSYETAMPMSFARA